MSADVDDALVVEDGRRHGGAIEGRRLGKLLGEFALPKLLALSWHRGQVTMPLMPRVNTRPSATTGVLLGPLPCMTATGFTWYGAA